MVRLENDSIEVFVLPEVGAKVWGAVVKRTGHEFIYRNEVMKFRNIALRGPWTSGGLEFNFGVIGHTPSTATPVDYVLREHPDGSVSCIVGTIDPVCSDLKKTCGGVRNDESIPFLVELRVAPHGVEAYAASA